MPSAGELLRRERIKRNLSISQISSATCIGTRYLEAIEEDNPSILPGDFFHRSFIKQYAQEMNLEDSLTRQILEAVGPVPDLDPLPALTLAREIAEVEHRSRPLDQIPTRVAALLFFVVVMGCSGLYALWNRAQEAADPDLRPAQVSAITQPSASAKDVAKDSAPAETLALAPQPTAAVASTTVASHTTSLPVTTVGAPNAIQSATASEPAEHGKLAVNIAATEKTWVSLSSEGRTVYSGILDPSQSKSFALVEKARLVTGNAAGLDVKVNGRAVGPLGSRGQVRLVLLSNDNFQVLTPHKM